MNQAINCRVFVSTSALALFALALFLTDPSVARSQSTSATGKTPLRIAVVGLVQPHAGGVWNMLATNSMGRRQLF